ncbi:MAG: YhcH/YjgK/YiaL family protein [Pleomorphochaeta sp.]
MIYDSKSNVKNYKGITELLDKALEVMVSGELNELEDGFHAIDGEKIFAHVKHYDTKDFDTCEYEAHKNYIDIHSNVFGNEICYAKTLKDMDLIDSFDSNEDIGFYKNDKRCDYPFIINEDSFLIVFPQDAHKPACSVNTNSAKVKKIVLKVLYTQ